MLIFVSLLAIAARDHLAGTPDPRRDALRRRDARPGGLLGPCRQVLVAARAPLGRRHGRGRSRQAGHRHRPGFRRRGHRERSSADAFSSVLSGLAIMFLSIFASVAIYRFVPTFGDDMAQLHAGRRAAAAAGPVAAVDGPATFMRQGVATHAHRGSNGGSAAGARAGAGAASLEQRRSWPPGWPPTEPVTPHVTPTATSPPRRRPSRPTHGRLAMTSEPIARRRTFVFGKPKPNAVIGRNREPGEIALLLAGGLAGLIWGLAVPLLALRVLGLVGFPAAAVATVYLPFRKRTLYRWFEINRSYRRLVRSGRARVALGCDGGRHPAARAEVEIRPPPGIGRVRLGDREFRRRRGRRPPSSGPEMHHGDGRDRGPWRRVARLGGPGGAGRPVWQPASACRERRRFRHAAADDRSHLARRPGRARARRRHPRESRRAGVAARFV